MGLRISAAIARVHQSEWCHGVVKHWDMALAQLSLWSSSVAICMKPNAMPSLPSGNLTEKALTLSAKLDGEAIEA
jgi:hypothetical protein